MRLYFIRVFALVFIVIAKWRFPAKLSIPHVIRKRYGNKVLKDIRRLEKLDFKYRKCVLDLEFLNGCSSSGVIPKFLQFKTPNKNLRSSPEYYNSQLRLLNAEIKHKQSLSKRILNELTILKSSLRKEISSVDSAHVTSIFLLSNDKSIAKVQQKQVNKLHRIINEQGVRVNNPDNVIFNYTDYSLNQYERSLLSKGLNFSLPPKKVEYSSYIAQFEYLAKEIDRLDLTNEDKDRIFGDIKSSGLSSLHTYENEKRHGYTISDDEFDALLKLSKVENLVIQKSDKGNNVVIVSKEIYVERMMDLLADSSKFQLLPFKKSNQLRYILNQEAAIKKALGPLLEKKVISKELYDKLVPKDSSPGIMYGLPKVHKPVIDNKPKYRPILSSIGTPQYNLAKFLVPLITPITVNEYTVNNSFIFAKEIVEQDAKLYMASLDVEALFTNLPIDETITIVTNNLFKDNDTFNGMKKDEFKNLLELAGKNAFFLFNDQHFKQTDGVAMGSPLGPHCANAFLCHYETLWLEDCPEEFKPVYYRRYVDDILVLFNNPDHSEKFKNYMNSLHASIKFTSENEENGSISFLDIKISRENDRFVTSIFRKTTFSGVYMNFRSFLPYRFKTNLILTLLHRVFSICFNWTIFHQEVMKLKDIFRKNGYPPHVIDACIKTFMDKCFTKKDPVHLAPKKEFLIILPYLGVNSLKLRTKLVDIFKQSIPYASIKVIFRSSCRLSAFFKFKDNVPLNLLSSLVYHFKCSACNSTYIGKTPRHYIVRTSEHLNVSCFTGKPVDRKSQVPSAIETHIASTSHVNDSSSFSIMTFAPRSKYDVKLRTQESLLIKKHDPDLNGQETSIKLLLFK